MYQLFLSHASEDKDFVRPLAEALKSKFKVWFDEYELTVGDSLLRKINAGLAQSDYGVVILSPSFFAKKWPQDELDGLFALEAKNGGKMILPVWKDIDQAGVSKHSPILASRFATLAAYGIDKVVEDLVRAISTADRARELSQVDTLASKFKALDASVGIKKAADQRLHTDEGVRAIEAEFARLIAELEKRVTDVSNGSQHLKFHTKRERHMVEVRGPFRLFAVLKFVPYAVNSASKARLLANCYQFAQLTPFEERRGPQELSEQGYVPYFGTDGQVVWASPNSYDKVVSTEQVLTNTLAKMLEHVEHLSKERSD